MVLADIDLGPDKDIEPCSSQVERFSLQSLEASLAKGSSATSVDRSVGEPLSEGGAEMALASEGYAYSRSSSFSASRSPDTASPIYPERAIRPLPKSRLKSKLSPDQASSIVYPPDPPPLSPTLNIGNNEHGNTVRHLANTDGTEGRYHRHDPVLVHDHCMCRHEDGESGDEEVEFDHPDYRYATSAAPVMNGKPLDSVQRRLMEASKLTTSDKTSGAAASATSSADGYESFENTSNKKKRKIPLSSTSSSLHQSSLSAELASMGISHDQGVGDGGDGSSSLANHYTNGPANNATNIGGGGAGTGISGAGRGRYGRRDAKDARRPLANTTVNTVNGYPGRAQLRHGSGDGKPGDPHMSSPTEQTPGIISRAIRTAAEAGHLTPQTGKENVSLLQQSASSSVTSPKGQFTFTCESDSASKMQDQLPGMADPYRERAGQGYTSPTATIAHKSGMPNGVRGHMTGAQGTQTMLGVRGGVPPPPGSIPGRPPAHYPANQQQLPAPAQHHQVQNNQQQGQPVNQKPPRPRRTPSKEYALAARQRKVQQQYSNFHHRPRREDMWICQFCEYEDIFGVPPVALIRSYEIKDRQERKKAAEKRRLLEKAKQRGRKGKKGSGKHAGAKGQGATHPLPSQEHGYDPHGGPIGDGEDYFDDDDGYADEYDAVGPDGEEDHYDVRESYPPPPPVPLGTPQDVGTPSVVTSPGRAMAGG